MEEFLNQYGQYIICGLTCLISILVNLLKKRPVVDSIDNYVRFLGLSAVPSLIDDAEKLYANGQEKKDYVIRTCITTLRTRFKGITQDDINYATEVLGRIIESYLDTPQKKEVK